jgi:hypothetical protein
MREVLMKKFIPIKLILTFIVLFGFLNFLNIQAEMPRGYSLIQSTCGNIAVVPTPSTGTYDDDIDITINISNNTCEVSALGFDLFYDTSMFSYQGITTQNCLTSDWSMLDAYEISSGHVRVGGYAGSGSYIQPSENGSIAVITLKVICQCGVCPDGQQSTITIDDYRDDLSSYVSEPAQGIFTLICCSGDISLPSNEAGTWGDMVYIPVNIANNMSSISDFQFDFVFDPVVFDFKDVAKSTAIQNWTTMNWSEVSAGKIRITGLAGSGTSIPASSSGSLVWMKLMVNCVGYAQNTSIPISIERYRNGIVNMCPRTFQTNFLYRTCPQLGDVNANQSITPGDAQAAFEIYLGKITATTAQLTTADANCGCPCAGLEHTEANNCITPGDAQLIFEHYLGTWTLPECCADDPCFGGTGFSPEEMSNLSSEKKLVYPLPSIGNSGDRVKIPVMVNDPRGVRDFSLEMIYPQEMLEYVGLLASPLTQEFVYVRGRDDVPGVLKIEGKGDVAIRSRESGSLCVAVFQVREGTSGNAPVVLYNFDGDIFDADAGSSIFVGGETLIKKDRTLTLGAGKEREGLFVVPVNVTNAFNVKAFGLEVKYSADKLRFVGVDRTDLTQDYIAVDGNEIASGIVRIGGYSMSGIQDWQDGILVRLKFEVSEPNGEIEITRVVDDLEAFTIY